MRLYNASLLRQDLIYLDANNLYGWAMSQSLPTHGFRFLSEEEISALVLKDVPDNGDVGYILEVDLHYPTSFHDDYPLTPEPLVIERSMYSPTQQSVFPETAPQTKLTPNLRDIVKHVVHYRNLKLYLQLGLVVTKVHRVLAFNHSPWIRTYININTLSGNCSFLKDFFKLLNNSVLVRLKKT